MLVVTRKPGEAIMVGDDIRVTLLSARGNRVRIGIEAPKEVCVRRCRLYEVTWTFCDGDTYSCNQDLIGEAGAR